MADGATIEVGEGVGLPEIVREPTNVQLFAFSAVTWNPHRIHYDLTYARGVEGYPDVLVQSHLHACFLTQALRECLGADAAIVALGWRNRAIAVPGDRLTVGGTITAVVESAAELRLELELEERNQRGEICVNGQATVRLPRKGH
ncbi:MAG: acyl dehydratase [Actinobacteria bacterium]|nr:acyl dehydratase [Actinomycetota bacterium]